MNIHIKTKENKNFSLTANPTDLICQIKAKIQEVEGIPFNQQQIIFDGENCQDELSLSNYNIQDNSNLLLINKEKSLLFKSSIIFDGSNLVDHIRQSIIDITDNSQEEDVLNLLNEAISYLDDNMDTNLAKELFSLILTCFSYFPKQSLNFLDNCLQKERISVYHIIATTMAISNLARFFPEIPINNYDDFIASSFQKISQQMIQN